MELTSTNRPMIFTHMFLLLLQAGGVMVLASTVRLSDCNRSCSLWGVGLRIEECVTVV